ncbi:hypothetical protein H4R99_002253 [Coemansia sp. RSA 1722]|nr:hypothetical protein LPJ57_003156 [Coemansia sp. RSA 486]KAJ2235070.1 hypothetical protein IWW45_002893 [Coemansia sp. RSA 485]KAJ2600553.1 hypothetical protein GGF39_001705 [Coemansia sp. RSA 1721]KAJ2603738.1 hypothetical protein H4R99_002253 [Coemansia sp. RSA 1722]KAJ2637926.1 hypothetical protein GGF40_002024 [Coemansia sp. RSA 1286]
MAVTLRIKLEPPLPERKFIVVCKQRTVKELRDEIRRRIQPLTKEPITLLYNGFELMDDDPVNEIVMLASLINVHQADAEGAPIALEQKAAEEDKAQCVRKKVVVSKRVHGFDDVGEVQEVSRKKFSAEIAYDRAATAQIPSGTDEDDGLDDDYVGGGDDDGDNSNVSSDGQSNDAEEPSDDGENDSDGPPDLQPIIKTE